MGQQQRVSIARALALEPEALLLDEPTSALDEAARRRIEELVRDLNARLGLTMVFVSHDLAQVERVADRVVVLARGSSEGEWDRDDFFSGAGRAGAAVHRGEALGWQVCRRWARRFSPSGSSPWRWP